MSEWKPWEQFKATAEVLPIHEPPCPSCHFWNPQRKWTEYLASQQFDGVILCHNEDMHGDFSCYRVRKVTP